MNKKKLTFDLDNVIFDMKPLYQTAFHRAGVPYEKPTSWILNEAYNNETVINNLLELFGDDMLYQMPLLDKNIPYILNSLLQTKYHILDFLTDCLIYMEYFYLITAFDITYHHQTIPTDYL